MILSVTENNLSLPLTNLRKWHQAREFILNQNITKNSTMIKILNSHQNYQQTFSKKQMMTDKFSQEWESRRNPTTLWLTSTFMRLFTSSNIFMARYRSRSGMMQNLTLWRGFYWSMLGDMDGKNLRSQDSISLQAFNHLQLLRVLIWISRSFSKIGRC